jgi:hypothetical protein
VVVGIGTGGGGLLSTPGAEAVDRLLEGRLLPALADLGAKGAEDEVTRLPSFGTGPFPVIAVAGTLRPRLFVAEKICAALSDAELRAALAHECGHLAAHDNLKRALLRACRDVLSIVPVGRALDRAWAESTEVAADEHAARTGGPWAALDLAAALIKIARLVPAGTRPAMPVGAYLLEAPDEGHIARRVRRLTQLATDGVVASPYPLMRNLCLWTGVGTTFVLLMLGATDARALTVMHTMLEQLVGALR